MKTLLSSPEFRAELPGWALRGSLCAAISAFWAVAGGFSAPAEIAGMIGGVAVWVALFAAAVTWARRSGASMPADAADALKTAAWIKVGLSVLGIVGVAWPLAGSLMFLGPGLDLILGLASVNAVCWMAGATDAELLARLDSVTWAGWVTIVQGGMIALTITILTGAILIWKWSRPGALSKRASA